jgi:hypothetical protein
LARRGPATLDMTTIYTVTGDAGWLTGGEVHTYRPFLRLGNRGQLGVVLAAGLAGYLNGMVDRRTESPIYATSPLIGGAPPAIVPTGPGFMWTRDGRLVTVPAGQMGVVVERVGADELYGASDWNVLRARAELAARYALHPQFTLRVGGGFNFPGVHMFAIEVTHFFGPRK